MTIRSQSFGFGGPKKFSMNGCLSFPLRTAASDLARNASWSAVNASSSAACTRECSGKYEPACARLEGLGRGCRCASCFDTHPRCGARGWVSRCDSHQHQGHTRKKSGGARLCHPDFVPIATGERQALANVLACPRAAAWEVRRGKLKWPNCLPTFLWRRSRLVFGPILWQSLSVIAAKSCAISKA